MAVKIASVGISAKVSQVVSQAVVIAASAKGTTQPVPATSTTTGKTVQAAVPGSNLPAGVQQKEKTFTLPTGALPTIAIIQEILARKAEIPNEFAEGKPDILFISDYVVDEQEIGALVVFERFLNATHYEVFKKNKFDNEPKFERILFLDVVSLEQETKRFLPFLELMGFELNENSVFAILDDNIKKDRIYEFFVRAGFVPPRPADLNFRAVMKSKDMIKTTEPAEGATIKTLAFSLLGNTDLCWIIPFLNNDIPFFGVEYHMQKQEEIVLPKSVDDLMGLINDSIFLFGAKSALTYFLGVLGGRVPFEVLQRESGRLDEEISKVFSESIDESNGIFSFDFFIKSLLEKSNAFAKLSESGNVLTKRSGTLSFTSLKNLSSILKYIQDLDLAMLNLQTSSETTTPTEPSTATQPGSGIVSIFEEFTRN